MKDHFKKFCHYIGNCVSFNYRPQEDREFLSKMIDEAKEITYSTLIKHVPVDMLSEIFGYYNWSRGGGSLRLKNDWAVSFYRSAFNGKHCYFVRHSAIEYIFLPEGGAL
jgi:hypothetical protein